MLLNASNGKFVLFVPEFEMPNWNPANFQSAIPPLGLTVPFGDTFLDVGDPNGKVYKLNPYGPAGSKWILMPEKGLFFGPGHGWVRKDGKKFTPLFSFKHDKNFHCRKKWPCWWTAGFFQNAHSCTRTFCRRYCTAFGQTSKAVVEKIIREIYTYNWNTLHYKSYL